jgi:hypothetical protein
MLQVLCANCLIDMRLVTRGALIQRPSSLFCSGFEVKLVLLGSRATEFDAEAVHKLGQEHAVVGIFVGTLVKSYRGQ